VQSGTLSLLVRHEATQQVMTMRKTGADDQAQLPTAATVLLPTGQHLK
jgi:hypothetical protein